MECKNCGVKIEQAELNQLSERIKYVKMERDRKVEYYQKILNQLEEKYWIKKNGFCGSYCESQSEEG